MSNTVPLPSREEFDELQEDEIPEIETLSRNEFVDDVFVPNYDPEQHVAILGPTRSGKTSIGLQLLDKIADPKLPAIVLITKPRDDLIDNWAKLSGFRKTQDWPPVFNRALKKKQGGFGKRQRGWVFWPRQSLRDLRSDDKQLTRQIRKILTDCYRKGERIIFADEVVTLAKDLGLKQELDKIWREGGAMKCPIWATSQRPFDAPMNMYSQSRHLLIFNDTDDRSLKRYDEIGGIEPNVVRSQVRKLGLHEFLYIGKHLAEDGVHHALAKVTAK